jgi:prevent-host-death family protein
MTHTISIEEAQQQFAALLAMASQGAEVVITQSEKPVVRLIQAVEALPLAQVEPQKRIAGLHRGAIWVSDDFDEPLPDSFWLGENDTLL